MTLHFRERKFYDISQTVRIIASYLPYVPLFIYYHLQFDGIFKCFTRDITDTAQL